MAVYQAESDRPIAIAKMEVTDARFGFEAVRSVTLTLTRRDNDGTQGLLLMFMGEGAPSGKIPRVVFLEVTKTMEDDCGSTAIYASRANQDPINGARWNIRLVDHRTRNCNDVKPHMWEASVRQGVVGWCGTGDATMELVGDPGRCQINAR